MVPTTMTCVNESTVSNRPRTAVTADFKTHRLTYVGVVETATKEFPKLFLSEIELTTRVDHITLVSDESSD